MSDLDAWTGRVRATTLPAALLAANLFLFGPFAIYRGNAEEFDVSLPLVLWTNGGTALVVLMACWLPITLLRHRAFLVALALLTGVAIAAWIQGNLLVRNYGQIGLGEIDWAKYTSRGWVDGAVWLVTIAAAVGFARIVARHAVFLCGALQGLRR